MDVAGEDPASVVASCMQIQTQRDSVGDGTSRLFTEPIAAPDAAGYFDPLPPQWAAVIAAGIIAATLGNGSSAAQGAAAVAAGVQTQFVELGFNPYVQAGGVAAGQEAAANSTAPGAERFADLVVRLRLLDALSGAEVDISRAPAPVAFVLPAVGGIVEDAAVAVCRFWDARVGAFSGEGCAALPSPRPEKHTVDWVAWESRASLVAPAASAAGGGLNGSSSNPHSPPSPLPAAFEGAPTEASLCAAAPVSVGPATATAAALLSLGAVAFGPAEASGATAVPAPVLGLLWEIKGPLLCGCKVSVLDCAADARVADDAARRTLAAGGDEAAVAAAAAAARTRVFLDPRRALTVPSVACLPADRSSVMRVFHGAGCQAWNTSLPCHWDPFRQTFAGPNCMRPNVTECACTHLTGASSAVGEAAVITPLAHVRPPLHYFPFLSSRSSAAADQCCLLAILPLPFRRVIPIFRTIPPPPTQTSPPAPKSPSPSPRRKCSWASTLRTSSRRSRASQRKSSRSSRRCMCWRRWG
jgi:hypothetical protein